MTEDFTRCYPDRMVESKPGVGQEGRGEGREDFAVSKAENEKKDLEASQDKEEFEKRKQ